MTGQTHAQRHAQQQLRSYFTSQVTRLSICFVSGYISFFIGVLKDLSTVYLSSRKESQNEKEKYAVGSQEDA